MFFSVTPATGQVTLTLADGAIIDNLRGVRFGLVLKLLNTAPCLTWTADVGIPIVFYVADGAALDRSASGADLAQIADNAYGVYACNGDSNRAVPAPAAGKGVMRGMGSGTVLIGSQVGATIYGGILPGDFVGTGSIMLQNGIGSSVLTGADFPGLTITQQAYGADPRNFGPQAAGTALAGPAAGPAALPTFRT